MKLRFVLMVICAALFAVPVAYGAGGSSADQGYGGQGNVQQEVGAGAAGNHAVASGSSLPFTGLDLALLVAGGATLVLVGTGLRRTARHRA